MQLPLAIGDAQFQVAIAGANNLVNIIVTVACVIAGINLVLSPVIDITTVAFGDTLGSFSHLMQQGWDAECVEHWQETSDIRPGSVFGQSDIYSSLDVGFGLQQFGDDRNIFGLQMGCSETDTGLCVDAVLDCLEQEFTGQNDTGNLVHEGFMDSGLNRSPQPSLDARDDLRPQTSIWDGDDLDSGTDASSSVSGISAWVDAAFAMLPLKPPEPVWEQGVRANIFGEGVSMKSHWCATRLSNSAFHAMPTVPDLESKPVTKKPRVRKASDNLQLYSDAAVHESDGSLQEERESLMQNALKRCLVTTAYFHPKTEIRTQLGSTLQEIDNLTLLADVSRGRALATMHERVRSAEEFCAPFGIRHFPPGVHFVFEFSNDQRAAGAMTFNLKGFMEVLYFCRFLPSVHALIKATHGSRCVWDTMSDVPEAVTQAVVLTVEGLRKFHAKLRDGELWDLIFLGAILLATYSRVRWDDLMDFELVLMDKDDLGTVLSIEVHTSTSETERVTAFTHQFLCLTAPVFGVTSNCWPQTWLDCRHECGAILSLYYCVAPAPGMAECPAKRPLSSVETSQCHRELLNVDERASYARKILTHSCKAACLSYCEKYGVDPMTSLQLSYHSLEVAD